MKYLLLNRTNYDLKKTSASSPLAKASLCEAKSTRRRAFLSMRLLLSIRQLVFLLIFVGAGTLSANEWSYVLAGASDVDGAQATLNEEPAIGLQLDLSRMAQAIEVPWSAEADALVVEFGYTDGPSGRATLVLEAAGAGERTIAAFVLDSSLVGGAKQREYAHFEGTADKLRVSLVADTTSGVSGLSYVRLYPVKRLAWNDAVEREYNFDCDLEMYQSFTVSEDSRIFGIAMPMTRMVQLPKSNQSSITCGLFADSSMLAQDSFPVVALPLDFASHAVFFLSPQERKGRSYTFRVSTDLEGSNAYYSDLLILQNWRNPYPGGHWGTNKRPEVDWDTAFSVFASVALPQD